MATYDLTQAELSGVISANLDASVRDFVLNFLFDDENSPGNSAFGHAQGMGHNNPPDDTIKVQISQGFQDLDKKAEALVLNNEHGVVETGGKLEAIIQNVSGDSDLRVTGHQDVLVATGIGDNFVDMQNSGDDIVLTGSGQDTVFDGAGNDTILAGNGNDSIAGGDGNEQLFDGEAGNDTIFGGDGNFDTLSGGDGRDVLFGGDGDNQLLQGGNQNDQLFGGDGDRNLLSGGTGADTIFGGDGDNNTLTGGDGADQIAVGSGANQMVDGGAGNDTIWAGEGGNTLFGGGGDDTFEINNHMGDSTIVGGGGHNTIDFNDRLQADVDSMETIAGQTTITFTDGQTITASQVQDLVFSDGTQHLP
jgi:Ca2+-binding RTX toxin-like protein